MSSKQTNESLPDQCNVTNCTPPSPFSDEICPRNKKYLLASSPYTVIDLRPHTPFLGLKTPTYWGGGVLTPTPPPPILLASWAFIRSNTVLDFAC